MFKLYNRFRRIIFNYKNKSKKILLQSKVTFNDNTILEGNNVIYSNSNINDTSIGFGSYISYNSKLPNSIIGKYCCVGQNVRIVFGQHPVKQFVSVHPAFYSTKQQAGFTYVNANIFEEHKFASGDSKKTVIIGNDVWIGQDVLIMEGIKIADGSVIGTGAIVTKDTEPYSINVGIPAKKIGYRFGEEQRQFLQSLKWWEKDPEWIESYKNLFEDVELLYEKFNTIED